MDRLSADEENAVVEATRELMADVSLFGATPPALADESVRPLTEAGADHVASTLMDTREPVPPV